MYVRVLFEASTPPNSMYKKQGGGGIFTVVLFMLGAGSAYALGALPLAVFCLLGVIGSVYNRWMKKSGLRGNLMVSFSVGMTFIYGGITAGLPFEKTVAFFAVLSALLDLGEEVAADAMDAEGDKKIGSRSIAILYGKKAALNVSSLVFACVVLLSVVPFFMEWFSPAYLVPILLMDSVVLFSVIKLRGTTVDGGRKYIKFIYQSGTSAILYFL